MKIRFCILILSIAASLFFTSCSGKVDNSIKFQNLSMGTVYINFRGGAVVVDPGETTTINEVPKGTYSYSTTFSIPSGASGSSSQGAVSGSVVMKAGTKILIIYSSTLINGNYILYATISSSDEGENPSGP